MHALTAQKFEEDSFRSSTSVEFSSQNDTTRLRQHRFYPAKNVFPTLALF
jgi:hypothetical protein